MGHSVADSVAGSGLSTGDGCIAADAAQFCDEFQVARDQQPPPFYAWCRTARYPSTRSIAPHGIAEPAREHRTLSGYHCIVVGYPSTGHRIAGWHHTLDRSTGHRVGRPTLCAIAVPDCAYDTRSAALSRHERQGNAGANWNGIVLSCISWNDTARLCDLAFDLGWRGVHFGVRPRTLCSDNVAPVVHALLPPFLRQRCVHKRTQ